MAMHNNKQGFQAGNKAAAKPAEMRVDGGGYSRININIDRKLKTAIVKAAYPKPFTPWIIDALKKKLKQHETNNSKTKNAQKAKYKQKNKNLENRNSI